MAAFGAFVDIGVHQDGLVHLADEPRLWRTALLCAAATLQVRVVVTSTPPHLPLLLVEDERLDTNARRLIEQSKNERLR